MWRVCQDLMHLSGPHAPVQWRCPAEPEFSQVAEIGNDPIRQIFRLPDATAPPWRRDSGTASR
jgi:hypothetical protein